TIRNGLKGCCVKSSRNVCTVIVVSYRDGHDVSSLGRVNFIVGIRMILWKNASILCGLAALIGTWYMVDLGHAKDPRPENPTGSEANSNSDSSGHIVNISPEALAIHRECLLIDGHNDLPWKCRTLGKGSFTEFDGDKPLPRLH